MDVRHALAFMRVLRVKKTSMQMDAILWMSLFRVSATWFLRSLRQATRFQERPGASHTKDELSKFLGEMNAKARKLGLPREVGIRAKSICVDAATLRFCRVNPRPVLGAAALYVACREYKHPMTLRDLAEAYGCNPRDVGRCYTTMLEKMHISRPGMNGKSYVHHLALKGRVSKEVYNLSEAIVRKASQSGLGGRNPMTLAAAALYLASCSAGEKVTQAEVAEAAGVGEESVRECCKALRASEVTAEVQAKAEGRQSERSSLQDK